MLPDRLCQLLTAYLDGEVSPRQQEAVARLLRESPEAQTLLCQLQADAERLRNLPRRQLEADFPNRVVRTISERRLLQARRTALARPPHFPAWVGLATAACVLFVAAAGSYLYFEAAQRWHDEQAAQKAPHLQPEQPPEPAPPVAQQNTPAKPGTNEGVLNPAPDVVKSEDPTRPRTPEVPENEPSKPPKKPTELAAPNPRIRELEVVHPGLLTLALRDLEKPEVRQRLRKELQRESGYHVELTSLGNGKALERLQAAFRAQGVRLLIDPEVWARVKTRRLKLDCAIYTESLTPEELARVLEWLAREDKQAETRPRAAGQFDQLLVLPLSADDRKDLTTLLGADPLQPPARLKGPLGVDIRQPISEGTLGQVNQTLT